MKSCGLFQKKRAVAPDHVNPETLIHSTLVYVLRQEDLTLPELSLNPMTPSYYRVIGIFGPLQGAIVEFINSVAVFSKRLKRKPFFASRWRRKCLKNIFLILADLVVAKTVTKHVAIFRICLYVLRRTTH